MRFERVRIAAKRRAQLGCYILSAETTERLKRFLTTDAMLPYRSYIVKIERRDGESRAYFEIPYHIASCFTVSAAYDKARVGYDTVNKNRYKQKDKPQYYRNALRAKSDQVAALILADADL